MIYTFEKHSVKTYGESFYVAPNATVLGQVELAEDVSVWFGAVIRGDVEKIYIGKGSNIKD
jgi:carbonic anhydrase/acetyltransferase-like protein (isoleucine patch superfamily)